ncbi:MAG: putative undecaprenyl-phosphate N-acetylglucosaminyl 1-phosphate transferase [bacterium]|nr:putative undecaprenyl-phosphate N-acetylglucosaminyl 1-phosphate transferase [bacterium]
MMELLVLVAAILGGIGATRLAIYVAYRFGFMDAPNPIVPDHRRPVAYGGGVGILIGAYFAMGLYRLIAGEGALLDQSRGAFPLSMMLGGILFLLVGLWDDIRELSPRTKTLLHLAALSIAMSQGGLVREVSGNYFFDIFFSGLWILAIVNAFNFIDVCDGLAGSVAVLTFGLFAATFGFSPLLNIALAGACLGFLWFNRPPARVFMGDAGSNFLGFMLGAFTLTETSGVTWWPYIAMMTLMAGVPFFDLLFQAGVRWAQGRSPLKGGPDSFALRLQRAGMSKWQVDLVAMGVASFFFTSAITLPFMNLWGQLAIIVLVNVFIVSAWRWLLQYEVRTDA